MPKQINLIGETFGRLTVESYYGKGKYNQNLWLCKCICGNKKIVPTNMLRNGKTASCGCLRIDTLKNRCTKNIDGMKFGRLTAIKYSHNKNQKRIMECVCICGKKVYSSVSDLVSGHTKSCGCLVYDTSSMVNRTHGLRKTKEYNIWSNMKRRCMDQNNLNYKNYGARGISVCDKWTKSFHDFYKDMGNCPDGKTLERIDNNGNYEPNNCKWATIKEQMRNQRTNCNITFNKITMCITDWASHTGIPYRCLKERFIRGWSAKDALTKKSMAKKCQ